MGTNSKTIVFKAIAVLISFCYLFSPLHKEVGLFLHDVVHLLNGSEVLVSHSHDRWDEDLGKHHEHVLGNSKNSHHHYFLDLFEDIFEDLETRKDSKDSNILVLKMDKHTHHQEKYKRPFDFVLYKQNENTFFITKKTSLGYLKNPLQPPQFFNIIT